MESLYIALSLPFFFILIAIEFWLTRRRSELRYNFEDTISNLGCGMGQQVFDVFFGSVFLGGLGFFFELGLFELSAQSVWVWIATFFGVDLAYYAFHRAAHRVNFLWAAHAVHHQSEAYNLSVALRQSWIVSLFEWTFYVPLVLLGVPPWVVVTTRTINILYQFWIHTRVVHKAGPLETLFNTPSHHRVHHGINPKYIDKNYAGVFIIWDKLFGTFCPEEDEPVYGTVKPLRSWNPLWANLAPWHHLAQASARCPRWSDKLRMWFAPPEWQPAELGGALSIPEASRATQKRYMTHNTNTRRLWVGAEFALAGLALGAYLIWAPKAPGLWALGAGLALVAAIVGWAGTLEQKAWALPFNIGRWLAVLGGAAALALA